MPDRRTVSGYEYDGSFEGLLCCVFESFARKEQPLDIRAEGEAQFTLCPPRRIETSSERARRVALSIPRKICPEAAGWVRDGFLSCAPHKELLILEFLRKGYRAGPQIVRMLQDETVAELFRAAQFVGNEAHLLKGFLRFVERDGMLTAVIEPKNFVLPLIAPHFAERLPGETFLIYDRSHGMALLHHRGTMQVFPADDIAFTPENEAEREYQRLWRQFYKTIAIEGRYNPKCRMTHCPKRYWQNMTELCGEISAPSDQNLLKNPADSGIMEEKKRRIPAGKVAAYDLHTESGRPRDSGAHAWSRAPEHQDNRRL